MAELDHLEDLYLDTRQQTDLWQSSQLAAETGTVKLEAQIPPKVNPDMNAGNRRSNEEIDTILADQKKTRTVETPEVQAVRQQYKEAVGKLGTGETALEEIGKAGRKVAEAIGPGIEVAGRAIGLDEEGAAALSKGFVEFIGGLPGSSESDLTAGIETALAALPLVGATVKGGKMVGKAIGPTIAKEFEKAAAMLKFEHATVDIQSLKAKNAFQFRSPESGISKPSVTKGPITLDAEGNVVDGNHRLREAIVRGDTTIEVLRPRAGILGSERGSVPVGGKGKKAGVVTPLTADEAIQSDALWKQANASFKTFQSKLSTQRQGVRSDVQVAGESRSPEALQMEAFLELPPGTILKDSNVVAAKRLFSEVAEPLRQKALWMAANPKDEQALLSLLEEIPKVAQATTKIAGVFAEPPRSVRLMNKLLPTSGMIPAETAERVRISDPYINQWLEFFKQQDELAKTGAPALTKDKLVQVLAGMKTPEEFIAAAKALDKPSKWDMFIEYWINGLLSGPATHATNMISNAATLAWGIPERQLAAMYSKEVRPSEALAMVGGILEAQGDAWRLAWQAFKAEESQIGVGKLEGPKRAITADALELTGVPGRAVDFLGSMIRLPGRTLLAADDYFKSIAYRAELRALAKRESFRAVSESGLSGAQARSRMREIEQRMLISPPSDIDEAAKEFASYVTFTRELGPTGQKVQALANTPVGRLVLPFVRTPTNIFKYAGERTPLALASATVRDEIAAGGSRRALALAKISLGAMTMSYVGMLAAEGMVTGGGPKDKQLRQEMMMTGWQPYSFKIGDTYYSYARIEPIGSLFGMAADAADLIGQLSTKDAEQLASALVVAVSRNVANKTFVKGLAGTLNAVSSQDVNEVKTFLEKELPTLLPASTGMSQTTRVIDPVMREVNSLLDAFKAKIPGLSDTLPPRRNLWGEPIYLQGGLGPDLISPIYTSTMKLDSVSQELVRLELPIGMPGKSIEGVPLDPQEYDAYVVLQGAKPLIGDLTLKQRLAEVMQSDLYKRASDGKDGGKKVLIQQWVSAYRDKAKYILSDAATTKEWLGHGFPDLQNQIQDAREKQAQKFNAPVLAR